MTRGRIVLILLAVGAVVIPHALDAQCNPATQRLITNRKYDDARTDLEAQLKRAPGDDAAMECIGRFLLDQGESSDAVDWLEKAVAINSKNAQHHLSLGLALRAEAGKASMLSAPALFGRMKTEYEQAVALDPALVDARYALLQVLAQVPPAMGGSIAKAREHSAELLRLNPIRGHLGYGIAAEQEKDFVGAEKEFLAAIAVRPDSDVAYGATGAFYRRRERWNDAVAMYEKQLKAMPKDATQTRISNAHYFLGMAHDKSGHGDKAKAEYQAAITANPKNEDAKRALASLKEGI
jgi:tetratricopeptide (TPR) repeat protein